MSSLKRHFTVVIGNKEHGLYVSSTPSSAARKAVSKLCADNKNKKVEFYMRETTQDSNKKIYGPYLGEMKKLDKPIELKGRIIQYSVNVHLKKKSSTTKTAKKVGNKLRGGRIEENGTFEPADFIFEHLSKSFNNNQPIHQMLNFQSKKKKVNIGKDQLCFFLIPVKIDDNKIYYKYAVYYSDSKKKLVIKKYNNNTELITDTKFEDIPLDDSKLFFKIIYHIINVRTREIPPEFAMNINYYKEHLKRVLPKNYMYDDNPQDKYF